MKSISAQNVELKGLINNENLTDILNDAVTLDSKREISGTKSFGNITIHFLETKKKIGKSNDDSETIHLSDIEVLDTISVENINFKEKLNDVDKDELKDFLDEELLELVLHGDRRLGNMTVYGNVYIESNHIGNVSLEDFENNTVKRDEPFDFDTVEFSK